MGVFDLEIALQKIHKLGAIRFFPIFEDFKNQNKDLIDALKKSYRKTHETIGRSDITGMTSRGKYLVIEIKGEKDTLTIAQMNYLLEVKNKGGVAAVVCEDIQKVRFEGKVFGFNSKIPLIQYSEEALKWFLIESNKL